MEEQVLYHCAMTYTGVKRNDNLLRYCPDILNTSCSLPVAPFQALGFSTEIDSAYRYQV